MRIQTSYTAAINRLNKELEQIKEQTAISSQAFKLPWQPFPIQQKLIDNAAFETLFGGQAGGTKSTGGLFCATTKHHLSCMFRRTYPELEGLIETSKEMLDNTGAVYNEAKKQWTLPNGKIILFRHMQLERDKFKYKGRAHDLKFWDEVTGFTESQYTYANGWVRSARPNQRCRIIATCNPPGSGEGVWIIKRWAAWIDPLHPNPAIDGEIRWFARIDGEDVEVNTSEPFIENGEKITPQSRTFIRARLSDNPAYAGTGYEETLRNLPEPLRSQLLYGDFTAGALDDDWQLIPTAWVDAAIKRGKEQPLNSPLSHIGVDPSRGGADATAIAPRHGNQFAPIIKLKGASMRDGNDVAVQVMKIYEPQASIHIDVGGIGASPYDALKAIQGVRVYAVNFGSGSNATDKTGLLQLPRVRDEMWWKFREALEPNSGYDICLPDDQELKADLCSPRWKQSSNTIKIESKDEIRKRLGRSTDKGDAVVLAWYNPQSGFAFGFGK